MVQLLLYIQIALMHLFSAETAASKPTTAEFHNAIIIEGYTNVNTFNLHYDFVKTPLLVLHDTVATSLESTTYKITMPVHKFKAENEQMKRDFLELMQAQNYPNIFIEIPGKHLKDICDGSKSSLIFTVIISGVRKQIECAFSALQKDNSILLSGSKELLLTDFNLSPRTYYYFIKVKNNITINFNFSVQV